MIYITLQRRGRYTSVAWRVGAPKPIQQDDILDVTRIDADGEELLYIQDKLSNLPMAKTPYVSWDPPFCTFIVRNLFYPTVYDKVFDPKAHKEEPQQPTPITKKTAVNLSPDLG